MHTLSRIFSVPVVLALLVGPGLAADRVLGQPKLLDNGDISLGDGIVLGRRDNSGKILMAPDRLALPEDTGSLQDPREIAINRADGRLFYRDEAGNRAGGLLPDLDTNGYLKFRNGMTLGRYQGGKFISQPDAVQIQGSGSTGDVSATSVRPTGAAAAQALADVAAVVGVPVSYARADLPSKVVPASITNIVLSGFYAPGDGCQGAVYRRGAGPMQTTDLFGGVWHLEPGPTARFECFGGRLDGLQSSAAANDAAWDAAFAYMDTLPYGAELRFGVGVGYFASQRVARITEGKHLAIRGAGKRSTQLFYAGATPITLFKVGSDTVADSGNTLIEGFAIYAPTNTAANGAGARAMDVTHRPGAILRDMLFAGYKEGIKYTLSYAPRLTSADFVNIKGRAIQTAADATVNGMVLDKVGVFTSGLADSVPAIDLQGDGSGQGGGNGVTIIAADIEANWAGLKFTNMSGVSIHASYIERNAQGNLLFAGVNTAFDIRANWLGEQTAVATWAGLSKSSIQNNNIYNTTTTFDASATDLDFGNVLSGTSTITNGLPWNTPTLLNGWANIGGGYDTAGYRKHTDGSVELKGSITNASNAPSVAFAIPVGYRPFKLRQFTVGGLSGDRIGQMQMDPNGNVTMYPAPRKLDGSATGDGYVAMDIRFTP